MSRRRAVLVASTGIVMLVAGLVLWPQLAAAAGSPVSGGGSSFAQLEIDQWRADTSHAPYNLSIDYAAQGSSFGRTQYLNGQLDYGVSDIQFQPDDHADQSPRGKNFTYVPVSAGGVGFMYNLKDTSGNRITNLHLTANDICRIFTVPNIYWDDPSIQASNPNVLLPHNLITRIVRSDGSGTSYVFSAYCIAVAPQVWKSFISYIQNSVPGAGDAIFSSGQPVSNWPTGYANEGAFNAADGVANAVANDVSGQNAITYNAAGFGQERGYPNAYIQNAAGVYHLPDANAASVALAYATPQPDGTFNLNYTAPDPNAYFPSTYSYVIAQTTGFDSGKGQTLATFLDYAVTIGQKRAVPLGYAPLSTVLVNEALDHILQIPGAPPRPTNLGNPPPPPTKTTIPPGGLAKGGATAGGAAAGRGGTSGGSGAAGGATGSGAGATGTATAGGGAATAGGTGATGASGSGSGGESAERATAQNVRQIANDVPSSKPVSNKDVAWYFLLGFGVVGVSSALGLGASAATKAATRGRGGA